jgi:ADP-ribosylglycohydrolase
MSRQNRLATMLKASLIADSLVLPAHWIYDPAAIRDRFGRLESLQAPPADGYHAGQDKGGQTHYGAQALALMAALGNGHAFDADRFMAVWTGLWDRYTGYRDGATKTTLANLAAGKPRTDAGSLSNDLGGAARIAPLLVALDTADDEAIAAAAAAQTRLTHQDAGLHDAAAFITRAVRAVLAGAAIPDAVAVAGAAEYDVLPIADYLAAAQASIGLGAVAAVHRLGAACAVTGALPATLALALTYPDDLETALVENAMAGGDSAARGLVLGMLLGAADGAVLPEQWLRDWQARSEVEAFLAAQ